MDKDEVLFRRYKTLMIPLGNHLDNEIISRIMQFFLTNSTLPKVTEPKNSAASKQPSFAYKCISMQMGVTKAPLSIPTLKAISSEESGDSHQHAIRVLCVLFDTQDDPQVKHGIFQDVLDTTRLDSLLTDE